MIVKKDSSIENIRQYLEQEIRRLDSYEEPFDSKSYKYEEGILITGGEAMTIVDFIIKSNLS